MSIDLIGYEYLQNTHYADINVVKDNDKYEVSYTIFIISEPEVDLKRQDLYLKTVIIRNHEEFTKLSEGLISLQAMNYDFISINQMSETVRDEMKFYYIEQSLTLEKDQFESLSIFSCLSVDPNRKIYNGPVSGELILDQNKFPNSNSFTFLKAEQIYAGAVHEHPTDGYMEGSFHRETPHEVLTLRRNNLRKINFVDRKKYHELGDLSRINKNFILQMPYVEDYLGNCSFVFTCNLAELILQNSHSARVLHKLNPNLFLKLAEFLKIKKIKVYRDKKQTTVSYNSLNMPVESENVSESKLICESDLVNGIMLETKRYLLKNKEFVNVNEATLKQKSESDNPNQNNASMEDISDGTLISKIEQLDPTEQSLHYYKFTDYEIKNKSGKKFNYSVSIEVENVILEHTIQRVLNIRKSIEELQYYDRMMQDGNEYKVLSFDKKFIEDFYSSMNISLNEEMMPLASEREKTKNLFSYKACLNYILALELVSADSVNYQDLFNRINFTSTNPLMFSEALREFVELYDFLSKAYILDKNTLNTREKFTSSNIVSRSTRDLLIKTKVPFKLTFEKSMNKSVGYSFMQDKNFEEILIVNNQTIDKRASIEKKKFLVGEITTQDKSLINLDSKQKSEFVDTNKKTHCYFTPLSINIANKKHVIDDFNQRTINKKFFNILNYTRETSKTTEKISYTGRDFLSSMNPSLTVANSPRDSHIITEEGQSGDYYVEADQYLNSKPFLNFNSLQTFNSIISQGIFPNEEVYSKIQKSIVNKKFRPRVNLKTFDLTKEENIFMHTNKKLDVIPVQLKSLMASASPVIKNNLSQNNYTDLQDPESAEIFEQIFLNIKSLNIFTGFKIVNGIYNFEEPVYIEMDLENFVNLSNSNFMVELNGYHIEGVESRDQDFNIYDNFFLVRNRQQDFTPVGQYAGQEISLEMREKDLFSRSLIVKQNLDNFGSALLRPIRKVERTTPRQQNVQTLSTQNLGGGTSGIY